MNPRRVAALLRELADEIERAPAPPTAPGAAWPALWRRTGGVRVLNVLTLQLGFARGATLADVAAGLDCSAYLVAKGGGRVGLRLLLRELGEHGLTLRCGCGAGGGCRS